MSCPHTYNTEADQDDKSHGSIEVKVVEKTEEPVECGLDVARYPVEVKAADNEGYVVQILPRNLMW